MILQVISKHSAMILTHSKLSDYPAILFFHFKLTRHYNYLLHKGLLMMLNWLSA